MHRKQTLASKTCWSAVVNTLSTLNPKKLFIFFLLASANAHQPVIYLRGNRNGLWNKDTCVHAAPDCLFEVSPPPLSEYKQICDKTSLENLQDKSLLDQMRDERFIGVTLCNNVITSTTTNQDDTLSKVEFDFNTPHENTYSVRHLSTHQVRRAPKAQNCPEATPKDCPKAPTCRVGMWAVSGQGGKNSERNPYGFRYTLQGVSETEVVDYSHKCVVMS